MTDAAMSSPREPEGLPTFVPTGEMRRPRCGELYLFEESGEQYLVRAEMDHDDPADRPRALYRRVHAERGRMDSADVANARLLECAIEVRNEIAGEDRCPWCGWTLKETADQGCIPGNCSMRPLPDEKPWTRAIARLDEAIEGSFRAPTVRAAAPAERGGDVMARAWALFDSHGQMESCIRSDTAPFADPKWVPVFLVRATDPASPATISAAQAAKRDGVVYHIGAECACIEEPCPCECHASPEPIDEDEPRDWHEVLPPTKRTAQIVPDGPDHVRIVPSEPSAVTRPMSEWFAPALKEAMRDDGLRTGKSPFCAVERHEKCPHAWPENPSIVCQCSCHGKPAPSEPSDGEKP